MKITVTMSEVGVSDALKLWLESRGLFATEVVINRASGTASATVALYVADGSQSEGTSNG